MKKENTRGRNNWSKLAATALVAATCLGTMKGCDYVLGKQAERRAELGIEQTTEDTRTPAYQTLEQFADNFDYDNGLGQNTEDLVEKVQKVIDFYSKGKSPVTAEQIIASSRRTGTPLEMYLVSGAQEGNFGTKGRAARTKNLYNVGNIDDGTNEVQKSWDAGLDRYGRLIAQEYFPGENPSLDKFIKRDFKRPDGARYMTNENSKTSYLSIAKRVKNMLN